MTIIYESLEMGKLAKCLSDQVIAELALDGLSNLNLWSFGVLGIPEVRNAAAGAAADADLVILSLSGTVPLPARALAWIDMWTWLIDGHRPVVVALFGTQHREGTGIRAYLRGKAGGKKLAFFPIVPRAGTSGAGELKERVGKAQDRDCHLISSLLESRVSMKDGNGTVVK